MTEHHNGGLGGRGSDSGAKPSPAGESSNPGAVERRQLEGGGGQDGQRLALSP